MKVSVKVDVKIYVAKCLVVLVWVLLIVVTL